MQLFEIMFIAFFLSDPDVENDEDRGKRPTGVSKLPQIIFKK